jgi:hypothetical protein
VTKALLLTIFFFRNTPSCAAFTAGQLRPAGRGTGGRYQQACFFRFGEAIRLLDECRRSSARWQGRCRPELANDRGLFVHPHQRSKKKTEPKLASAPPAHPQPDASARPPRVPPLPTEAPAHPASPGDQSRRPAGHRRSRRRPGVVLHAPEAPLQRIQPDVPTFSNMGPLEFFGQPMEV